MVLVGVAGTARARIALSIYALSLMGLFGASAVYHRVNWRSLRARDWMRRLDQSMIFVLIAGSYTLFAMLVLHGPLAIAIPPQYGRARASSTCGGSARPAGPVGSPPASW